VQLYHTQAFFVNDDSKSERCLASTPTYGGDAFSKELAGGHRFGSLGLNIASKGLLLGVSLRLWAKGYLMQPVLDGARDSKQPRTLVRMTGHVLQGVKDAGGLRVKVRMVGWNESFRSCESKECKPGGDSVASNRRTLRQHQHMSPSHWSVVK
jgi:hypothetical protein